MKYLIPVVALAAATPVLAQTSQYPDASQMFFKTFDANRDSKVSKDEFVKPQVQRIEAQFDQMDKNKDGKIDDGEFTAFDAAMREQMQKRMKKMKDQGEGQYKR